MKVLIIGAGRMGVRHAQGALSAKNVTAVCLVDIADATLEKAASQFVDFVRTGKLRLCKPEESTGDYEIAIIASTASKRIETCKYVMKHNPAYVLVEKPLGQSYEEVASLVDFFRDKKVKAAVNLNMRMYAFIKDLKHDLKTLPQFSGFVSINFTGGSLGIGANGIHYLDLLFYLFDADRAELISGEIEADTIPSGRGPQFGDFGGWACIGFFDRNGKRVGRSLISLSATSTVFGGWEIIGPHGRIRINELESQRVDILRNPASTLPVNRYGADYLAPTMRQIESPLLGNLTQEWIEKIEQRSELPALEESLKTHRLLFDWLNLGESGKDIFPIT